MAARVAAGLGLKGKIAPADAAVTPKAMDPSPMLSILAKAFPTLEGRKVGCMVTDGSDGALIAALQDAVEAAGAVLEIIAPTVGGIVTKRGDLLAADHEIKGAPSILFDAVAILPSEEGGARLALQAEAVNFLRDAYGHLKTIAYLPSTAAMFVKAGMADTDASADAGLVAIDAKNIDAFINAAAKGRVWTREPMIHPILQEGRAPIASRAGFRPKWGRPRAWCAGPGRTGRSVPAAAWRRFRNARAAPSSHRPRCGRAWRRP